MNEKIYISLQTVLNGRIFTSSAVRKEYDSTKFSRPPLLLRPQVQYSRGLYFLKEVKAHHSKRQRNPSPSRNRTQKAQTLMILKEKKKRPPLEDQA